MSFLTESQVRSAAQREEQRLSKKAGAILKEHASSDGDFDIFLCHSITDEQLVLGTVEFLKALNARVYVDWIDDPQLDRTKVDKRTADTLRARLRSCRSLLYLHTLGSTASRWMPWELGYFDSYRHKVAILPIVDQPGRSFVGAEYLSLYPLVETTAGGALTIGGTSLRAWISAIPLIKSGR